MSILHHYFSGNVYTYTLYPAHISFDFEILSHVCSASKYKKKLIFHTFKQNKPSYPYNALRIFRTVSVIVCLNTI